ncbi:MAG: hypothetical protein HYV52_01730 [Parcubacteria group bacterium]|nr:hypothetical protein [Parcubacteria group bacterium]
MKEKIGEFQKYTLEDKVFFDSLAKKYNLDQDSEHLIIKKEGKEIMIPKWRVIPLEKGKADIEEFIQKNLSGQNEEK